ncbi:MAG: DUF1015 domain-containing protein [Ruminococcaceae bacterium]|nr:DUF1015 domain-containing protein [Oscillospiraceae bacterium]
MKKYLYEADIYLPDFEKVDGSRWATVACDQFTSEREYWENADAYVGGSPSALRVILPEAYLDEAGKRIGKINSTMEEYLKDVLVCHKDTMIYLERVQSDGKVRRGIVGAVDLEEYDYSKGSQSLIRATEGTVLDRIPPRVAIRRDAQIELPHIMILIDDEQRSVIEPIAAKAAEYELAYDFDLMLGGGHATGRFIPAEDIKDINIALDELATSEQMLDKYGINCAPLLFAMGDGNHSLATAKALYEEIKAQIGAEAAKDHPARYALCEIVNLHDEALEFEPIYRVVFGVEPEKFVAELSDYAKRLCGAEEREQKIKYVYGETTGEIVIKTPECQLTVGSVQQFIDEYIKTHKGVEVDYIHGLNSTHTLAQKENAVGLTFDGMEKNQLFRTVICDGALPRKTFSMGHAEDKRYYIECRRIK